MPRLRSSSDEPTTYVFGSNALEIGFGASPRKNSSGVLNGIPIFAAKSLCKLNISR